MTDWTHRLLTQQRLIFALVGLFALAGVAAYLFMQRQENPSFPYRAGLITVAFPGAGPARIERLVVKPLEEQLAEVSAVDVVESTMRQGFAVLSVRLRDNVYDTDAAWNRVRVAMDTASRDYPEGVARAQLDDRIIDASLMVLTVTGNAPARQLADAVRTLRRHIIGIDGVAKTRIFGDPGRQITIAIDDAAMARNGLSPARIAAAIQANDQETTSGTIRMAGDSVNLDAQTDFDSIADIQHTAIPVGDGASVPLASLASVHESDASPPQDELWFNGQRGVGLEIIAERGQNVVALGQRLRAAIEDIRPTIAPLQIREMFYQPAQTQARLRNLSWNLLGSVAVILVVLFLFMGLRLGLVVALLLPLVTLTTLAIYAIGGGILEQIAIIGLVVALGMLVDNAIVMSEDMQWRLNAGVAPSDAASGAIRDLAGPLFAATGTTLAAFVPMLLAKGNTADFTRTLPITIMLALSVSYLYAISVTPLVCQRYLRPQQRADGGVLNRLGDRLADLSLRAPVPLIVLAVILVAAALLSQRWLNEEFFPQADRDLVVVELSLPEGTHVSRTAAAAHQLEAALRHRPGVGMVHIFVGGGGPTFYYNLQRTPAAPQLARLVVMTDSLAGNQAVIAFAERYSRAHLPDADVVAHTLGQGPIINAPIEVRIFNPDAARLVAATQQVLTRTQALPGMRDVRSDLGTGVPSIHYRVHEAAAQRYGITAQDVARSLAARSDGLTVGEYRGARDPMPIRLSSPEGEDFPPSALDAINVYNAAGDHVPLMQVASTRLVMQPGAIRHYNQSRVAHVYSELAPGAAYSKVLAPLERDVAALKLPAGTRIEYGGNAEESDKANTALAHAAPLGLALLLFFLLFQFNSFVRVLLVLLTAPFALVGVIPGLLLLDIPFGFMPLLGMIALVGIVVNNAIVLIDVIDQRLAEGATLKEAIGDSVRRRTRPIVLTTATTIAGLLPLALSHATLWPPMAWPIITGLLASTVLTLLVLPSICLLVLKPRRSGTPQSVVMLWLASVVIGLAVGVPATARAASNPTVPTISLGEALQRASSRPRVDALRKQLEAAQADADRVRRSGRYPSLSARVDASHNHNVARLDSDQFASDLPAGTALPDLSVPLSDSNQYTASVELRQPVLDIATQFYAAPAAAATADAASASLSRGQVLARVAAADAYLHALEIQSRLHAQTALADDLAARTQRMQAMRAAGRALKSDLLEVRYALDDARQQEDSLADALAVARLALGQAVGNDGPLMPVSVRFEPPVVANDAATLIAQALSQRRDLKALDARIAAANLQAGQIEAQRLPRVDAVAGLDYSKGTVFLPEHNRRVGAELTWQPFAGGAISAQKRATNATLAALEASRIEASRGIALQVRQALSALRDARRRARLGVLGVESAQALRDSRSAQLDAGRVDIDDLLNAESQLAGRRAAADVTKLDLVAAWIRLQAALGDNLALNQIAP